MLSWNLQSQIYEVVGPVKEKNAAAEVSKHNAWYADGLID